MNVLGKAVNEKGLGKSLMERLCEQYATIDQAKSYCITLCNNYRCLPEILELSSHLFYESSLVQCAKVPRIKEYGLHFISVDKSKTTPLDCEDVMEAEIIVKEAKNLIVNDYIDTTNICIMCCSQRQVRAELLLNTCPCMVVIHFINILNLSFFSNSRHFFYYYTESCFNDVICLFSVCRLCVQ